MIATGAGAPSSTPCTMKSPSSRTSSGFTPRDSSSAAIRLAPRRVELGVGGLEHATEPVEGGQIGRAVLLGNRFEAQQGGKVLGGGGGVDRQRCELLGGQRGRCGASAADDDYRYDGEEDRDG